MSDVQYPKCVNCTGPNWYGQKYGGYCLDCSNAGVPEKDEELAQFRELFTGGPKTPPEQLYQDPAFAAQELARLRADLQRIVATCSNLSLGKTADEICHKTIRMHDSLIWSRDEIFRLRTAMGDAHRYLSGTDGLTAGPHEACKVLIAALAAVQ